MTLVEWLLVAVCVLLWRAVVLLGRHQRQMQQCIEIMADSENDMIAAVRDAVREARDYPVYDDQLSIIANDVERMRKAIEATPWVRSPFEDDRH